MEESAIYRLPHDSLHQIFSSLPLRQIMSCRLVCKFFNQLLTSPSFLEIISSRSPLTLLALRHHHSFHVYNLDENRWYTFDLSFLPFRFPYPVASSAGLVYLWAESFTDSTKSLVVCNPLSRQFKVLPQLGSAWSKHGSVLVDSVNRVMVLTELAALYFSGTIANKWLKFSSNLPSKPRSPVLTSNSVFALCDVGSPWRSQWKLFLCKLTNLTNNTHTNWVCLEKHEWGDIFDIIKGPRLVRGNGDSKLLMIGGLKSTFSLNPSCSTILILRLDLETLDWEEAGRMPLDMHTCFQDSKFKVFGNGDTVCFSAKRMTRLALWDSLEGWRWIDGAPGNGDGLSRGFVFEATLTAVP